MDNDLWVNSDKHRKTENIITEKISMLCLGLQKIVQNRGFQYDEVPIKSANLIMNIYNHQKGFTILELLIVVLIIGILSSLAIYGLIRQNNRTNMAGFIEILGQDINYARSTAMSRGQEVRVNFISSSRYTVTIPPTVAGGNTTTLLDQQNTSITMSGVNTGDTLRCNSLGFCNAYTSAATRKSLSSISVSYPNSSRTLDITVLGLTRIRS